MAEEVKTYNTAEKGFATRCSMHTHGTFSTPSYGGVGEPYRKDREDDPRAQGLQFTTNKQTVAYLAEGFQTRPWTVEVGGLVHKPGPIDVEDLLFHTNSAVMMPDYRDCTGDPFHPDEESTTGLRVLAVCLRQQSLFPAQSMLITGHTDTRGSKATNLELSHLRASVVRLTTPHITGRTCRLAHITLAQDERRRLAVERDELQRSNSTLKVVPGVRCPRR